MGLGRDLAREAAPGVPHHDLLENFRDQLLVALLARLADSAGTFQIPVEEVDGTGGLVIMFGLRQTPAGPAFHFEVRKKQ